MQLFDGYWEPYQVAMILDPAHRWQRRTFQSEPAHYFKLGGVSGWQPAGGPLPDGAEDLGVRAGGWDHEHCEVCRAHIGAGGAPDGFVDADDRWLCDECYHRYAVHHDIGFVAGA